MEPVQTSYFINGLKNIAGNFKKKKKTNLTKYWKSQSCKFSTSISKS